MRIKFLRHKYPEYDIGDYTYGMPSIVNYRDGSTLKIGKFCCIAGGVTLIIGGNHYSNRISQYPHKYVFHDMYYGESYSKGDLVIGHDVWIGIGAIILSGIEIGNGAVIGAGSVIVKDVAPYAIMVGNPAREIGKRFDDETIEKLQKIQWWYWSDEKIKANTEALTSTNIDKLMAMEGI